MNDEDLQKLVDLKGKVSDLIKDLKNIEDKDHKLRIMYDSKYSNEFSLNFSKSKIYGEPTPLEQRIKDKVVQEIMVEIVGLVEEIRQIVPEYKITDPEILKVVNKQKSQIDAMKANLDRTKSILDLYAK